VCKRVEHFTCSEDVGACITAQSEVVVVTVGTVGLVILARERTVDQRHFAVDTLETVLVPVLVLVRQVLPRQAAPSENQIKPL